MQSTMTANRYPWKPSRDVANELIAAPGTTATTLLILISKALESQCPEGLDPFHLILGSPERDIEPMDTLEIWQDLEEFYGGRICEANENRVNALILALSSDAFEQDAEAFMAVCNALADGDLGDMLDGVFELPQIDEMWWALREVSLVRGTLFEFSEQVLDLMEKISEAEDHGADRTEIDDNLVEARFARMVDELTALGAPPPLVESIRRHAGIED